MKKRKLDSKRLYKLAKIIVIIVSSISSILAFYWLYLLGSNTLLHSWEEDCARIIPTDPGCMLIGLGQITDVTKQAFITLGIAIGLPIIFFGGTALFKYLFPKKEA